MDVLKDRDIDQVIVLGSGMSILDLSKSELEYINRCKVVIGVNKYMAFYKKSQILPTHVYFHDSFSKGSLNLFKYIIQVCRKDNLEYLTFITNPYFKLIADRNSMANIWSKIIDLAYYRLKPFVKQMLGFSNSTRQNLRLKRELRLLEYPENCRIDAVRVHNSKWAHSLSSKLFHFRGSLTSVLNYISICYPNREIYLVGNDFNGANYFYEEELNSIRIDWRDFTFEETKKQKKHYSFQDIEGEKMSDKFPFITSELLKSGNQLYCNNKDSLLVKDAGVKYKKIEI